MVLKFHKSVTKELKLKVKQFWELIPTFVEITGKKPEGPPLWIGLSQILLQTTTKNPTYFQPRSQRTFLLEEGNKKGF